MEKTSKSRDIIIALAVKYNFNWRKILNAISNKEIITDDEINSLLAKLDWFGGKIITIIDDDYPEPFRTISNPPFVIMTTVVE